MTITARSFAALPLSLVLVLGSFYASAQKVSSEGWAELSAGKEFYVEVPMIDNKDLKDYGIGRDIVAESVINSVRYAGKHPDIHHVVFKMDTGGGSLMHAEAMQDVIERYHTNTEFHIVIQDAISAGIWTAFSCDTIFMCRAGTIGGATAYYQLSSDQVMVAGDIPEIAARLAITAKRNGYPPQLIEPLMLMKTELHTWLDEDGERVLSQTKPEDAGALNEYKMLDRDDTVLTLTTEDAIEIGIARPIAGFDAQLVGKQIGVPGWTRANRYGEVIDEIGTLYNTTRVMEDQWVQTQLNLDRFPITPQNRNNQWIKDMRNERNKHVKLVEALRMMNKALNELPNIHPERHIYLEGEDGTTIVADAEAWRRDARDARGLASRLVAGMRELVDCYKDLEIDTNNLDHIQEQVDAINARITGIANAGSVAYWQRQESE
ncbi:MAG: hypothetical protein ACE37H_14305 [Phycisphaeraceae bacterium]